MHTNVEGIIKWPSTYIYCQICCCWFCYMYLYTFVFCKMMSIWLLVRVRPFYLGQCVYWWLEEIGHHSSDSILVWQNYESFCCLGNLELELFLAEHYWYQSNKQFSKVKKSYVHKRNGCSIRKKLKNYFSLQKSLICGFLDW